MQRKVHSTTIAKYLLPLAFNIAPPTPTKIRKKGNIKRQFNILISVLKHPIFIELSFLQKFKGRSRRGTSVTYVTGNILLSFWESLQ